MSDLPAAASSADRKSYCEGSDECKCRRTQKVLDDAKEKRIAAYTRTKPSTHKDMELAYPSLGETVFYSACVVYRYYADDEHPLSVQSDGSPPLPSNLSLVLLSRDFLPPYLAVCRRHRPVLFLLHSFSS